LNRSNNAWWAPAQELGRGWTEDHKIVPILKARAQSNEFPSVRDTAVVESRGWKDHAETLPILKGRASSDENHACE